MRSPPFPLRTLAIGLAAGTFLLSSCTQTPKQGAAVGTGSDQPAPAPAKPQQRSDYPLATRIEGKTTQVISARKSPWQNPFAERVISSIRRECTDHVIALGERHLVRVLRRFATYYNESRTHLSLDGNSPSPRQVEDGPGDVIAVPHLGGLHHRYVRAA